MGKGKSTHETPIEFLVGQYGYGDDRELHSIYDADYRKKHARLRPLTADYVGTVPGTRAYVEVFSKGDEWRQVMGKVVAYAYELQQNRTDMDIWMVSVDLDPGWLDWYRRVIQIAKGMITPDVRDRVHYLDFDSKAKVFRDIPV